MGVRFCQKGQLPRYLPLSCMLISAHYPVVFVDLAMGDPSHSAVNKLESPRVVHGSVVSHASTPSVAILITE